MLAYEVKNLCKQYSGQNVPANDGISLTIEAGEFFGLLGDNGAGKTTLIKQMANLLSPSSGDIRLFGQFLNQDALYVPRQVGYMPQNGLALNNATVEEAFYFTGHLRGLTPRDARAEREHWIKQLDLGALRQQPIARLSGGQQRLVALGVTLTAHLPVLILDEPTNDLAPQNRVHVWDILRKRNAEQGTTIILVTHNVLEAEKVIQRVGILKEGKLLAVGRPGVLKASLHQRLRLEVIFAPDSPPRLPDLTPPQSIAPGRWLLYIEEDTAALYLEALRQSTSLEDFSLTTATLEDLYMSLVERK